MKENTRNLFPSSEQRWIFYALIFIAGFFGVYTFSVRGGVFCNAQTANVALFAMSLGTGDWHRALYLLIPMSAYFLGAVVSELLNKKLSHNKHLKWSTALIGFEMLVIIVLGLLPRSAPDQICQVALNFICSMQFNTFRHNEGTPMATIFVTNHIRETGSNLVKALSDKDPGAIKLCKLHAAMIGFFLMGGLASAVACVSLNVRALLCTVPVFLYVLIRLLTRTTSQTN